MRERDKSARQIAVSCDLIWPWQIWSPGKATHEGIGQGGEVLQVEVLLPSWHCTLPGLQGTHSQSQPQAESWTCRRSSMAGHIDGARGCLCSCLLRSLREGYSGTRGWNRWRVGLRTSPWALLPGRPQALHSFHIGLAVWMFGGLVCRPFSNLLILTLLRSPLKLVVLIKVLFIMQFNF